MKIKPTTIQTAITAMSMVRSDVVKLMSAPPTENDKYWVEWIVELDDALSELKDVSGSLWRGDGSRAITVAE